MSNSTLKYGLIGGLAGILFACISYVIGFKPVINSVVSLVSLVVYVFIGLYSVREYRNENEGKITFGKAFQASFYALVITVVISLIFTFVLFKYIDPGYMDRMKEQAIEYVDQNENIPPAQKEKALEQMDRQFEKADKRQLVGFAINLGMVAVFSLIISLAVKKDINEPQLI